MKKVVFRQ